MCGIVGYVGSEYCREHLFKALRRLEYRGYDSSGLAINKDGKTFTIKSEGKLASLEKLLGELPDDAKLGIGHTRWATHGPAVTKNAHPHTVEDVTLVHNGIIENYYDLKNGLIAAGSEFASETDTEVIAHLLLEELRVDHSVEKALCRLTQKLKGAYSLGILVSSEPEKIFLLKQGSPLIVGFSDSGTYFASDIMGLSASCESIHVMQDGEIASLDRNGAEFRNFRGEKLKTKKESFEWTDEAVEKHGYSHFMLKEIHEQTSVLSNSIIRWVDSKNSKLDTDIFGLKDLDTSAVNSIRIASCGSAYLSGLCASYEIERLSEIPVYLELASEFRYKYPVGLKNSLFIAITQSGETADTLAALKYAKEQGALSLSICNNKHAEIPRLCDFNIFMDCGPEIGVASTKAFSSMILSLSLLAQCLSKKSQKLEPSYLENIKLLPFQVQTVLASESRIRDLAQKYHETSDFLYIGRGPSYGVAIEGALKLKEISYIHAEAYAAGELKHGPIALIDPFLPTIVINPSDAYYDKTLANTEEVYARKGKIIGLGASDAKDFKGVCEDFLDIPQNSNASFQAILNTVALQLFSYYVALFRGTNVDQPRNLAKSVTVE